MIEIKEPIADGAIIAARARAWARAETALGDRLNNAQALSCASEIEYTPQNLPAVLVLRISIEPLKKASA